MRRLLAIPALAAALLLAACDAPAEFRSPLSEPGSAPYDQRLIGRWYAIDGSGDEPLLLLVIEPGAEGGLEGGLSFSHLEAGGDGEAGFAWFQATAHASVIDGDTYYNAQLVDGGLVEKTVGADPKIEGVDQFSAGVEHGYMILRAEVAADGMLTLRILSEQIPNERQLAAHEVKCGDDCAFKLFDLSPEELAALIRSEDRAALFAIEFGPFSRIGAPPPPE
jgi:hypothetical protein